MGMTCNEYGKKKGTVKVLIDMETKRITLQQEDKTTTTIYASLSDVSNPIGSILLLHDMAEHHGRFDDFVRVLNGKGYDTYTFDHRGHGSEIRFEDLGFIAEDDGYELLISDASRVLNYVKKVNRGRRLILFGAGMGALIAICLMPIFDTLSACILCASPNPPHKKLSSLITSAKFIKFSKKPRFKSIYLSKKITEFKNFSRISNRTSFDWVSRDNELVGSYMSDPLCGFLGTVSFYLDVLNLADEAVSKVNFKQIKNDLPILLLAGSHDPVCDYGQETTELFDMLQRYHLTGVDCTIYEECRHDLLHETNNAEIIKDILEWLNRAMDNRRLKAAAEKRAKLKKGKGRNRTAAEAARSALGYTDNEGAASEGSIRAEDVGDDDDFLEDMGYFDRGTLAGEQDPEEDEEFIIMDDEEDDDDFFGLDDEDEEEPVGKDGEEADGDADYDKKSSGKAGKKDKKAKKEAGAKAAKSKEVKIQSEKSKAEKITPDRAKQDKAKESGSKSSKEEGRPGKKENKRK